MKKSWCGSILCARDRRKSPKMFFFIEKKFLSKSQRSIQRKSFSWRLQRSVLCVIIQMFRLQNSLRLSQYQGWMTGRYSWPSRIYGSYWTCVWRGTGPPIWLITDNLVTSTSASNHTWPSTCWKSECHLLSRGIHNRDNGIGDCLNFHLKPLFWIFYNGYFEINWNSKIGYFFKSECDIQSRRTNS